TAIAPLVSVILPQLRLLKLIVSSDAAAATASRRLPTPESSQFVTASTCARATLGAARNAHVPSDAARAAASARARGKRALDPSSNEPISPPVPRPRTLALPCGEP